MSEVSAPGQAGPYLPVFLWVVSQDSRQRQPPYTPSYHPPGTLSVSQTCAGLEGGRDCTKREDNTIPVLGRTHRLFYFAVTLSHTKQRGDKKKGTEMNTY